MCGPGGGGWGGRLLCADTGHSLTDLLGYNVCTQNFHPALACNITIQHLNTLYRAHHQKPSFHLSPDSGPRGPVSPSLSPPSPLVTANLLLVSLSILVVVHFLTYSTGVKEILKYLPFSVWLISFSIILSRSIRVVSPFYG